MPVIHYEVRRAWGEEFLGHIDADPMEDNDVMSALQARGFLPEGYQPADL